MRILFGRSRLHTTAIKGALVAFLLLSALLSRAAADTITWYFSGATLADGGSMTGSLIYDTASKDILNWDITVTANDSTLSYVPNSVVNPFTFTPDNSYKDILISTNIYTANTQIRFLTPHYFSPENFQYFFYNLVLTLPPFDPLSGAEDIPLTYLNSSYYLIDYCIVMKINYYGEIRYENGVPYETFTKIAGGELTRVPLPPSAYLLASGLIPLLWARRSKRLRRQPRLSRNLPVL